MSNEELIAELRRAADKKRADLALQSAALFTRAADALEAADGKLAEIESLAKKHINLYCCDGWREVPEIIVGGTE